jgi:uncharacterized protein (DUF433 family)
VSFETRKPVIGDMFIPFGLFARMLADGGTSEEEIRREYPQIGPRELRVLLAYARSLPADVEDRFHLLMHDSYWVFGQFTKAKSTDGKGYWSHYQLRSVREHGGREAVKRYLSRPQAQEGFDRVRELNLVPYSIEALVLEQPWSALFTPTELETARRRLASVGYPA